MARAGRKKCPAARKRLDISSIVEKGGVALYRAAAITIAAGDTFNGALITALLDEKPLPEAIRFAHAAAAIAVTRKGAQPSVPWREEIDAFLDKQR